MTKQAHLRRGAKQDVDNSAPITGHIGGLAGIIRCSATASTQKLWENDAIGGYESLVCIYRLQLRFSEFWPRTKTLIYIATLYFFAGSISGTLFGIRALFVLLGIVLLEFLLTAIMRGTITWNLAILIFADVQIGYFAGICVRGALESLGYSFPSPRTDRLW